MVIHMTPSLRGHADKMTRHHMFWRRKAYNHNSRASQRLRNSKAFIVPMKGLPHDLLHEVVEPLTPPPAKVCDTVYEIGQSEYHPDPLQRVGMIADTVINEAIADISPERSDNLRLVGYHLLGQIAIMNRQD